VCPLDLPHIRYHPYMNDCTMYWNEYTDKTICPVYLVEGSKEISLKSGMILSSIPACSDISRTVRKQSSCVEQTMLRYPIDAS
jgi:hypothetical protein